MTQFMTQWMSHLRVPDSAVATVAIFFMAWGIAWLPIAIPLAIALQWQPPQPPTIAQKIPLVLSLYALAPILLWAVIHFGGGSWTDYGIRVDGSQAIALGLGLAIAVTGVALLYGLNLALGWNHWRSENWPQLRTALAPTLALGLIISGIEEPIFRGFVQTQLQQDYSWAMATLLSSLIFALLHLVWDGKAGIPQLPGLWLMGAVLVLARGAEEGALGLAWGLHAGWVWAIASLDTAQISPPTGYGPTWLTGNGQPLAGLLGLALLLLTGGLLLPWQG
jgi:uncharacterized protein